jgi:hypothetical protein
MISYRNIRITIITCPEVFITFCDILITASNSINIKLEWDSIV